MAGELIYALNKVDFMRRDKLKLFIECPHCHKAVVADDIYVLLFVLAENNESVCESCGQAYDTCSVFACARQQHTELCSTCRYRYLCLSKDRS